MPLFTESQLRNRFNQESHRRNIRYFSAATVLNESKQQAQTAVGFDIFLSHSSNDKELIAGLTLLLKDLGYTVYVDWFDPELNHNNVTPETAAILRTRMSQCKSMIYAFSENASISKWMPWELGYFDALKDSKIAVLPISKYTKNSYIGSEYVGLYYHIQIDRIKNSEKEALWVHNGDDYVIYSDWIQGHKPFRH